MRTLILLFLIFLTCALAMEHSKFEKCHQKDFCRRLREQTDESAEQTGPPAAQLRAHYVVDRDSVQLLNTSFSALLTNVAPRHTSRNIAHDDLIVTVEAVEGGVFRVRVREMDEQQKQEKKQLHHTWSVTNVARRRPTGDVLLDAHVKPQEMVVAMAKNGAASQQSIRLKHANAHSSRNVESELEIAYGDKQQPFQVTLFVNGKPSILFNGKSLLTVESIVRKANPPPPLVQQDSNNTVAYEGESALGMDFTFLGSKHVFGIPERATDVMLKPTRGPGAPSSSEPYRMYNLDIFKYELNNPIGLYGVVPLLQSITPQVSSAVFVLNPSEIFVDLFEEQQGTTSHWIMETGLIDVFFIPGPTPRDILRQYTYLTGTPAMPQQFALGHHQCRWNYKDEEDVKQVDEKFDEHNIPYDVIWLDIEHTDDKKYFTWDSHYFPDPERMLRSIESKGRKMVTISDPHIKRASGYHVHEQATQRNYYIKNEAGTADYEGHCWPGSSSWLDLLNPEVRNFYASLFQFNSYKGSTRALYTWIDMNEPSVFSGPEITMHKNAKHVGGIEHREVHNQYGFYQAMATYQGHLERQSGEDRPFILTRSFFAGSQRYAFVWTGDNEAKWDHLDKGQPMLISMGLSAIPYIGADVGGFFDNPETQLLVRWYQAGAFYPFFRAHAHIETQRREPWLFGEENTGLIRAAIARRYRLLPLYYTLAYEAHVSGAPLLRPLFFEYPSVPELYGIQDQFLIGRDLLVKPVTSKDASSTEVVLPRSDQWFLFDEGTGPHQGNVVVSTPLDFVPVYQRGGSIIPLKMRLRRSSTQMLRDPVTLQIAPDQQGNARGLIYIDDGRSFNYQKGDYVYREFVMEKNSVIKCVSAQNADTSKPSAALKPLIPLVERIVVLNQTKKPEKIVLATPSSSASPNQHEELSTTHKGDTTIHLQQVLDFDYDQSKKKLSIRKPNVSVGSDWTIHIHA